ncbi:MAG: hypothetical protein VR72_05125 [Clostridiaceae bacterium BRH_c20a]|nr:MAG: hypothetical protein VR72_05125 [Clostridiaceae bacterium BRH_c20a]
MDFLAEKLKIRKIFLYLLFLVAILFFYTFFLKVEIAEILSKKENIAQLESQLTLIEKQIKGIDSTKLKEMEHRTQEFKRQYDLGLESQLVLLDAHNLAVQANLEIIGFTSLEKNELEDFKHRQYILTFMGGYSDFLHWLKLLEEMPYYINIHDLYISKFLINKEGAEVSNASEKLVFRVTINNIAIYDNLNYGGNIPANFRAEPFDPGIVNRN